MAEYTHKSQDTLHSCFFLISHPEHHKDNNLKSPAFFHLVVTKFTWVSNSLKVCILIPALDQILTNKAVLLLSALQTQPDWIPKPTEALELFFSKSSAGYLYILLRTLVGVYTPSHKQPKIQCPAGEYPSWIQDRMILCITCLFSKKIYCCKSNLPTENTAVFVTECIHHVLLKHFREDCIKEKSKCFEENYLLPATMKSHISSIHLSFKIINMLRSKD